MNRQNITNKKQGKINRRSKGYAFMNRVLSVLLFAIIFAVIGLIIPESYYRNFDKTQYYKIESPVIIENKDYYACDYTDVYINRTSLIDSHGNSIINLTLIREDGNNVTLDRIKSIQREVSITKGTGIILTHWEIPCDVIPGKYYYEGVIEYEVRGIKKYTSFVTETFAVKE